ncbi:hypothetical protein [Streptomyces sp. NPDC058579]|uniref:hypothetical protein n=1 Tax=Streptomyces sp. NPDC058579 TaxID=3346548 RepID=UPI0036630048
METTVRQPRKRARGLVLAAVLISLAELTGWWCSRDGGLRLVAQVFHHPLLFGVLVVGLLTAAVFVGVRSLVVRILTGIAAGLAAVAAMPFFLFGLFGLTEETSDRTAPGLTDRHLVIEEGSDMIDPLWWVYVDEGWGPTQRRWKVGYFNGDDYTNGLYEAHWAGPNQIRLVTGDPAEGSQVHLIDLDPETGKPLRTLTMG